jgi:hypothetical protein
VHLKEAKKTVVGASRSLVRSQGARRSMLRTGYANPLPIDKNGMLPHAIANLKKATKRYLEESPLPEIRTQQSRFPTR